ncbi:MAG: DNA gyrase C-terminal beta-propeller domain-containing protein, partial [Natronospirillum sp.]
FWLKVYQIPQAGRQSRGRPLVNLLQLSGEERVTTVLPVREYTPDHFVFMATANGTVKKTSLESFARRRSNGLIALSLDDGDHLVKAAITDGTRDIMLFSQNGKAVRFPEDSVREMGRTARGVRGIRLAGDDRLISLILPDEEATVLTVSEKGFGKRTLTSDFPTKSRATLGVISMVVNDRNGPLVAAIQLTEGDQVMLISDQGTLVRTRSEEISVLSRNTQGVRIIRLSDEEKLVGVDRIEEPEEVDELEESGAVETLGANAVDTGEDIDSSEDDSDVADDADE